MWYELLIRKAIWYSATTSFPEINQFGGNGGTTLY